MLEEYPFIKNNIQLAKYTWFQVGGKVDYFIRPRTLEELNIFFREKPQDMPLFPLGAGSNILIREGGMPGAVIKLAGEFTNTHISENIITVGAACLDKTLSLAAANESISGLEFLSGIPGTLGGAIAMNAGCYGSEIKDILLWVEGVDYQGKIQRFSKDEITFSYRTTQLPSPLIVTRIALEGVKVNQSLILKKMEEIQNNRIESQPTRGRTGGSTFKNPPNFSAWKLIDEAGCRGLQIGDAQMSEKHCNFMLNLGKASAEDLESLGETVRERVFQNSGIDLQWEILRIGAK